MAKAPKSPQAAAQLLRVALQAHQSGRLEEAMRGYRQVLQREPGHVGALANLASVHTRLGQYPEALACYQKALQGQDAGAELWFNYGNLQQRLGQSQDAVQSFEYALRLNAGLYPAHYNLGNLLRDLGRDEAALEHYQAALRLNPQFAAAHRNLGNLLRRMGRAAAAIEQHAIALELEPQRAENHYNLANALADAGEADAAVRRYQDALRLAPGMAMAWLNLGNLQQAQGQAAAAEDCYRQALAQPDAPAAAYANLARLLQAQGRQQAAQPVFAQALERYPEDIELLRLQGDALYHLDDAAAALAVYEKIEALQPGQAGIANALGVAYRAVGRLGEAERAWLRCLEIDPRHVEALTNLGTLYRLQKRHEAALKYLRLAIEIRPDDADSVASLACALIDLGSISEALGLIEPALAAHPEHVDLLGMQAFALVHQARVNEGQAILAKARRLKPDSQVAIGNSLFSSLYSDSLDAAALSRFHRELAGTLAGKVQPDPVRRVAWDGRRPLRIGYVSPDFRTHPVGFFIEPVLKHHDASRFEVTCYALPCAQDAVTERLKGYVPHWRDCEGWKLERMAKQIRQDGIDILVDLAGHTAGGRMDLMARKPAPIQAVFLGYPYTTGLMEIDYLIADRYLIPPELESFYTERIARLEHSFLCYQPQPGTPEVAPLPALVNGYVTFGSYNNLPKLSAACLDLWAEVLRAVPDSRLLLMASSLADAGTRELFRRHFAERGIAADRIVPLPPVMPLAKFLAEYGRIDIALDPMPFNGGTTSCDALWMGVPVVTLAGTGFMGRMGDSLLHSLGHPEWVAQDKAGYIHIARQLAGDIAGLVRIRAQLRPEMQASGLSDAAGYTRSLEGLYLGMPADLFAGSFPVE